jgi:hypothetical protein
MTKTRKNKPSRPGKEQSREPGGQIIKAADPRPASVKLSAKPPSKQQQLASMLVRDEDATLDQMIAATGWLPHTTRAALTGLKKKGYALCSDKVEGVLTYRAVAPE